MHKIRWPFKNDNQLNLQTHEALGRAMMIDIVAVQYCLNLCVSRAMGNKSPSRTSAGFIILLTTAIT